MKARNSKLWNGSDTFCIPRQRTGRSSFLKSRLYKTLGREDLSTVSIVISKVAHSKTLFPQFEKEIEKVHSLRVYWLMTSRVRHSPARASRHLQASRTFLSGCDMWVWFICLPYFRPYALYARQSCIISWGFVQRLFWCNFCRETGRIECEICENRKLNLVFRDLGVWRRPLPGGDARRGCSLGIIHYLTTTA